MPIKNAGFLLKITLTGAQIITNKKKEEIRAPVNGISYFLFFKR
jgi:hypothetical protein